MSVGSRILHFGLLLVVAGALISWRTGRSETLILYPDREETHGGMTVGLLRLEVAPDGGARSLLEVDGREVEVAVNRPATVGGARLCQLSYIADGGSVIGLRRDLPGMLTVYAGYALFALGGAILVFTRRGKAPQRADVLFAATVGAVGIAAALSGRTEAATPAVLRTWWLPLHVSLVIMGYGALFVVAVLAAARRPDRARRLLPSAIWLLGLGIIAGSLWAELSWGRYWGWDPKETWALITLLVAALPLHLRRPGRWVYVLPLAALATTWLGVNLLASASLHAY